MLQTCTHSAHDAAMAKLLGPEVPVSEKTIKTCFYSLDHLFVIMVLMTFVQEKLSPDNGIEPAQTFMHWLSLCSDV